MSDATWDGTRPAPTIPPERKILQDLIAELRDEMWKGEDMDAEIAITRAETRLREVQGD